MPVVPGTCVENIDFAGHNIQVIGTRGADVTTIDGGRAGHVMERRRP